LGIRTRQEERGDVAAWCNPKNITSDHRRDSWPPFMPVGAPRGRGTAIHVSLDVKPQNMPVSSTSPRKAKGGTRQCVEVRIKTTIFRVQSRAVDRAGGDEAPWGLDPRRGRAARAAFVRHAGLFHRVDDRHASRTTRCARKSRGSSARGSVEGDRRLGVPRLASPCEGAAEGRRHDPRC